MHTSTVLLTVGGLAAAGAAGFFGYRYFAQKGGVGQTEPQALNPSDPRVAGAPACNGSRIYLAAGASKPENWSRPGFTAHGSDSWSYCSGGLAPSVTQNTGSLALPPGTSDPLGGWGSIIGQGIGLLSGVLGFDESATPCKCGGCGGCSKKVPSADGTFSLPQSSAQSAGQFSLPETPDDVAPIYGYSSFTAPNPAPVGASSPSGATSQPPPPATADALIFGNTPNAPPAPSSQPAPPATSTPPPATPPNYGSAGAPYAAPGASPPCSVPLFQPAHCMERLLAKGRSAAFATEACGNQQRTNAADRQRAGCL